ncbi:MAG: 2-C-methyl-D-erythritol 2,4-cyclodiphosphate synthase [Clostridia bacterium]|nr:2-C-methyl-D-erythritol 2,4-cyclodiphosphate synthase [Clostridia bacterium]
MKTDKKSICAVLLAAGSSTRMGENKMLMRFMGETPIRLSAEAFVEFADEFVFVVSNSTREAALEAAQACEAAGKRTRLVNGGKRRQDSVYNAIIATDADIVAIHDCARCCVSKEVIELSIASAIENGCGVASCRVIDTLRYSETGEVVDRDALLSAQTPQSFLRSALVDAYDRIDGDENYTDDAAVYAAAGNKLYFTKGSSSNIKLTGREDIVLVRAILNAKEASKTDGSRPEPQFRIGYGEDTHRLKEGRSLILGGVQIPFEFGLDGHSDADALAHALIDAVLGACALGDIGMHFPDSDMRYKGINSLELVRHTAALIRENGFEIGNLDATVIAQRPKLGSYRDEMREKLAEAFSVELSAVSVKFTTPEHTGPEGRGESMTVRASALVFKAKLN